MSITQKCYQSWLIFYFFKFVFELSCVIIEVQFWVISFVKLVNQIINQHQAILYVLEVDVVVILFSTDYYGYF